MGKNAYDIEQLKRLGIIDATGAYSTRYGSPDYLARLRAFESDSPGYLGGYNAAMVFARDSEMRRLVKDLKSVRATLTALGMSRTVSEMVFLEAAIFKRDIATLTVELLEFQQKMKGLSKQVASARIRQETGALSYEKGIILAVDDQPALLATVVKMLQDYFTVIAVTSAKAALKVLEKHTPELVLLDIEMPGLNGYEFARILRNHERFESTPIIFLTSKNNRADVITAISHGGNDYIIKPVEKELLLSKIRRHTG